MCFPRLEENVMKKISSNEALNLISQGIFPKCQVARDVFEPVKSEQDLKNLLSLSSSQMCQFYGYEEKDIEDFKVPSKGVPISVDDATDIVVSGKRIHARAIGESEQSFSDLEHFVVFLRQCDIEGKNFLLWHE